MANDKTIAIRLPWDIMRKMDAMLVRQRAELGQSDWNFMKEWIVGLLRQHVPSTSFIDGIPLDTEKATFGLHLSMSMDGSSGIITVAKKNTIESGQGWDGEARDKDTIFHQFVTFLVRACIAHGRAGARLATIHVLNCLWNNPIRTTMPCNGFIVYYTRVEEPP